MALETAGDRQTLFPMSKIVICCLVMRQDMHLFICLYIYLFVSQKDLRQLTKRYQIQQDDIN